MNKTKILIENALAAGRGMIEARLTARAEGDQVRLEGQVSDNTEGRVDERLERVHEPLTAANQQDQSELALAVGMALARRVLRDMGGPLHAEAHRGAGLTVGFSLSLAPASAHVDAPETEPAVAGRAAHILIVDDNATNRMVAEARQHSERMVGEAREEAARIAATAKREYEASTGRAKSEADRLIESGNLAYEKAVQEGIKEQQRLVSETEVVQTAHAEATRMVDSAHAEADRLRGECDIYVDTKLAEFEEHLQGTLRSVSRGRHQLRTAAGTHDYAQR